MKNKKRKTTRYGLPRINKEVGLPVVCAADWREGIAQGIRLCLRGIVLRSQIDG